MISLFCLGIAFGQGTKNFIDENYIEVTGSAKLEVVPDEIYIEIILDEDDTRDKMTIDQLENSLIARLGSLGIDVEKDLKVLDLTSSLRNYFLKDSDVKTRKEYQLIVNSGQLASSVFLELSKLGISSMSVIRIEHSKIEELLLQTKVEAVKAARFKARNLAEAIDQNIGKAMYIEEMSFVEPSQQYSNIAREGIFRYSEPSSVQRAIAAPIEFEIITLNARIRVRFKLE